MATTKAKPKTKPKVKKSKEVTVSSLAPEHQSIYKLVRTRRDLVLNSKEYKASLKKDEKANKKIDEINARIDKKILKLREQIETSQKEDEARIKENEIRLSKEIKAESELSPRAKKARDLIKKGNFGFLEDKALEELSSLLGEDLGPKIFREYNQHVSETALLERDIDDLELDRDYELDSVISLYGSMNAVDLPMGTVFVVEDGDLIDLPPEKTYMVCQNFDRSRFACATVIDKDGEYFDIREFITNDTHLASDQEIIQFLKTSKKGVFSAHNFLI